MARFKRVIFRSWVNQAIAEADEDEEEGGPPSAEVSSEVPAPAPAPTAGVGVGGLPRAPPVSPMKKMAKPMKKAGGAGRRAQSVAIGAAGAKAAAVAAAGAKAAATVAKGEPEPVDFTIKVDVAGAIGIVWSQFVDDGGRTVSTVKAIRPDTPAGRQSAMTPGFMAGALLGYVNGEWVKGRDYFECIKLIKETRPLELGFCGRMPRSESTSPSNRQRSPDHQFSPSRGKTKPAVGGAVSKPPRRIRAQSVAVGAKAQGAASASLAEQMAAAAAMVDAGEDAPEGAEPADFHASFGEEGPLGIVWSSTLNEHKLDYAYIKAVKPNGQAAKNEDILPGLILGYVNKQWVQVTSPPAPPHTTQPPRSISIPPLLVSPHLLLFP
eukprot:SAG11_NODE_411_length_9696_cov_46.841513_1_plen_379_part_10